MVLAYSVSAQRSIADVVNLSVEGIEESFVSIDTVGSNQALLDDIECLRLAVKDDFIPDTMFTDCDPEEPSTIYYVGVLPDLSVMVSAKETDNSGGDFLDIVNKYYSNKLAAFFRVSIEDSVV